MIHPDTLVHYIDTELQIQKFLPMKDLVAQYSDNAVRMSNGAFILQFGGNVMVQDGFGWTSLESIAVHDNAVNWMQVRCLDFGLEHCGVIVTNDELLMIYHPEIAFHPGFHGRRLAPYSLMQAQKVEGEVCLRKNESAGVNGRMDIVKCALDTITGVGHRGYEVCTRSSSYAAGGFQLFGSDRVDMDIITGVKYGWK